MKSISLVILIALCSGPVLANPLLLLTQNRRPRMTVNTANWTKLSGTRWTQSIAADNKGLIGKSLSYTASVAGVDLFAWDPAGSDTSGEVIMRLSATNPGTATVPGPGGFFGPSAANMYYCALVYAGGSIKLRLAKIVSGTNSTLVDSGALTMTTGSKYWIRFRLQQGSPNALSGKFWAYGTAEPGSWTVTTTDTSLSGTGYAGSLFYAVNFSPVKIDYFSYAAGTGTAPGP